MKVSKVTLLAIATLLCSSSVAIAYPQQTWTHIHVRATVEPSCIDFSASDINFGTFDPLTAAFPLTTAPSTVTYTCTVGTSVNLTVKDDCAGSGSSTTGWALCDSTSHYIPFQLGFVPSNQAAGACVGSGSVQTIVNGTPVTGPLDVGTGSADLSQKICADIPGPGSGIYVGNGRDRYQDRLRLTLSY